MQFKTIAKDDAADDGRRVQQSDCFELGATNLCCDCLLVAIEQNWMFSNDLRGFGVSHAPVYSQSMP